MGRIKGVWIITPFSDSHWVEDYFLRGESMDEVCAICGMFLEGTPEEKMLKELHDDFGKDVKPSDCDKVCETCYQAIMKRLNN